MDAKTEAAILKLKKAKALSDVLSAIDVDANQNTESIVEIANIQFELITQAISFLEG